MVLIGGIGVQRLMPFGRPDEVQSEVRRLKVEMSRRGGYVLASAKPLLADVPTANAETLIEAATENE